MIGDIANGISQIDRFQRIHAIKVSSQVSDSSQEVEDTQNKE
jgi:hypothetical protein